MNFVMFQGHLTADPVMRQDQNGKSFCTGKIGVWQGKDQNGNDLDSLFIDFICYGNDATTVGTLGKKGDLVVISGSFRETKNIGNDGREYINKRVSGNAKVCQKLPAQSSTQAYVPNTAQPYVPNTTQPVYQPQQGLNNQHQAQVNQLFSQPQQNSWSNM